ncbi:Translation initiation factor IF2/IF5 [Macleaya cordata]|uniref:Eukaryotic translation initiation factor 2 subunit beta n=1 Tax=Macleaya cordata TaxID=56857 RepID=A0A200R3M8_MACCD|nr:Translation initiation factor IF2/IF5 [Macleaya cordata]
MLVEYNIHKAPTLQHILTPWDHLHRTAAYTKFQYSKDGKLLEEVASVLFMTQRKSIFSICTKPSTVSTHFFSGTVCSSILRKTSPPTFCLQSHGGEDDSYHHKVDLASGNVQLVTSKEGWNEKLSEASRDGKIVVANFSASWCGPCRMLAPLYGELSEKYPTLMFLTIDVDELPAHSLIVQTLLGCLRKLLEAFGRNLPLQSPSLTTQNLKPYPFVVQEDVCGLHISVDDGVFGASVEVLTIEGFHARAIYVVIRSQGSFHSCLRSTQSKRRVVGVWNSFTGGRPEDLSLGRYKVGSEAQEGSEHNKQISSSLSVLSGQVPSRSSSFLLFLGVGSQPVMAEENLSVDVKDDVAELAPFDPTKKKKKKKVVVQDPTDDSVEKLTEKTENLSVADGIENAFAGLKKKKKKPVETDFMNDENGDAVEDLEDNIGEDEEGEGIVLQARYPWEGSDRDYEYEELLGRVFNILRENNPELAGDRRRTVMRPPQVLREGTKKTVFVNFMDLCKTMHRQPEHVMTFLLAEMGTSGSLDGQQRLVVKGRFAPKNFEGILRRYVNEYVICNGCKSPDTILSKENRLFFLRCEQCGSGRSVAPIKAGFVARVGRRKAGT